MIYCMSDIHGELDRFKAMLDLINFSSDDTLYIIGKRKIAVYRPKGKTGWHPSDVIPLFAKSLGNLAPWQTFFGKMPMR